MKKDEGERGGVEVHAGGWGGVGEGCWGRRGQDDVSALHPILGSDRQLTVWLRRLI